MGTVFNVNGTLNSNNATAIGSAATVNIGPSGNFNVGANQTISALYNSVFSLGTVTLGSGNTLAIGSSDNLSSSFSGSIGGNGAIIKAGSGSLTLSGTNTYANGTTIANGTLIAGTTASLGSNPVTLDGGTLRVVPSNGSLVINGFGGTSTSNAGAGTPWVVNGNNIGNAINSNVLSITTANGGEARSAFYNTPVLFSNGSTGFTASFTYQDVSKGGNDGATFVLQNDTRGTAAVGNGGSDLGYSNGGTSASPAITPSVAIGFDIDNDRTGFGTDGAVSNNGNTNVNTSTGSVNLNGGDPINVSITYNPNLANPANSTITETLTDATIPADTTTITYTSGDLTSILNGGVGSTTTALVGFTGGTGGGSALENISNFLYTITEPVASATYVNGVNLIGGDSGTIDVAATAAISTITMGDLTVGSGSGTTLNITATTAPMGQAYGLTLGAVTLNGSVTINVANNTVGGGNALGTLTLGALNDNLAPATSGGYTINSGWPRCRDAHFPGHQPCAWHGRQRQWRLAESQRRGRLGQHGHGRCRLLCKSGSRRRRQPNRCQRLERRRHRQPRRQHSDDRQHGQPLVELLRCDRRWRARRQPESEHHRRHRDPQRHQHLHRRHHGQCRQAVGQ